MKKHPLYTIGHGNRKAEELLDLLKRHEIDYLVDVRSMPFSKFNPQFNKPVLTDFLKANQIRYVYLGDLLGGKPKKKECYQENGLPNYEKIKEQDFFLKGIERLKNAYEKNLRLAFMCSETNPSECHRSRLITPVLLKEGVMIKHIDEEGNLLDQEWGLF